MTTMSFVGRKPTVKYRPYLVAARLGPMQTNADVERVLNQAKDWCRFGPRNWIIITSKPPKSWYERLHPLVEPAGELFISPIDLSDAVGMMPEDFWEWVKKWKPAESKSG